VHDIVVAVGGGGGRRRRRRRIRGEELGGVAISLPRKKQQ